MFRTGQIIETHRPAHAFRHAGITDPSCIIPAETMRSKVLRITRSKRGLTLWVRPLDGSSGYGVDVDAFRALGGAIEVVA